MKFSNLELGCSQLGIVQFTIIYHGRHKCMKNAMQENGKIEKFWPVSCSMVFPNLQVASEIPVMEF